MARTWRRLSTNISSAILRLRTPYCSTGVNLRPARGRGSEPIAVGVRRNRCLFAALERCLNAAEGTVIRTAQGGVERDVGLAAVPEAVQLWADTASAEIPGDARHLAIEVAHQQSIRSQTELRTIAVAGTGDTVNRGVAVFSAPPARPSCATPRRRRRNQLAPHAAFIGARRRSRRRGTAARVDLVIADTLPAAGMTCVEAEVGVLNDDRGRTGANCSPFSHVPGEVARPRRR
jgi:hypothetical protein